MLPCDAEQFTSVAAGSDLGAAVAHGITVSVWQTISPYIVIWNLLR